MAFLLYKVTPLADGHRAYQQVKEVVLAGGGLIYEACKKYLGEADVGWTVSCKDLLSAGGYDTAEHSLVIDIAPNRKHSVDLFEIQSISGYSYPEWTPLMVTFVELFAGEEPDGDVQEFKRRFDDNRCNRRKVREFLYLTGGYSEGTWNWGGNSRTTAALLWDDAWNYFQRQIM